VEWLRSFILIGANRRVVVTQAAHDYGAKRGGIGDDGGRPSQSREVMEQLLVRDGPSQAVSTRDLRRAPRRHDPGGPARPLLARRTAKDLERDQTPHAMAA